MKNKILTVTLLSVLFGTQIAEAKYCIGCRAELPDTANYCSKCSAPQSQTSSLEAPKKMNYREYILNMFQFLDSFEQSFRNLHYLEVLGKMPDIRVRFQNAALEYRKIENILPEELRLLAKMYEQKFNILNSLNSTLKDMRLDPSYKEAMLEAGLYEINLLNDIINVFRKPIRIEPAFNKRLKEKIANVANRCRRYHVTSKYLKIGGVKAGTGSAFIVMAIIKDKAHVLLVSPSSNYNAVSGNVNLSTLERNTSWVKENEFIYFDKVEENNHAM